MYQKTAIMSSTTSVAQSFFTACCEVKLGVAVRANAIFAAFHEWLGDAEEISEWASPAKFYKELPPMHQKGLASWASGNWIPNLTIREDLDLIFPKDAIRVIS